MSSKPYRTFHTETSNEVNARILSADPSEAEYDVLYFEISCIAATARHILEYGGAKWTNRFPKVLLTDKTRTRDKNSGFQSGRGSD